jgi:phosphoribosylglycinamide formyltransferase-1
MNSNSSAGSTRRICVLVSGRGSNKQAIHKRCLDGTVPAKIAAVITNNPHAGALEYAAQHCIASAIVNHRDYANKASFELALTAKVNEYQPDLVALAGFMRVLTADFTDQYSGHLINIHPSLLPRYKGLNTHQRALAGGDRWHGCSVHFVSPALDGGPLIARAIVPVLANDTEVTLANRVLQKEHILYPQVIADILNGTITCRDDRVLRRGLALRYPETI